MDLSQVQLLALFGEINQRYFDGFLEPPTLSWNSRLRSSAGRFIPGSRKYFIACPPRIEVASYLHEEENGYQHIWDTMAHEMIHYWLWVRHRPFGHTDEFIAKMKAMGVSRYNPVPRRRPVKYIYECLACSKHFPARKRLGTLACARCCNEHAGGKYDVRFKLVLRQGAPAADSVPTT